MVGEGFPYRKPKILFLRNLYNTQACAYVAAAAAAAVVALTAGTVIMLCLSEELMTEILTPYRLDLSDVTCNFRTVAIFVIIKLQAKFHTHFTGKCIDRLPTTFHFPSCNSSYVIICNPKGRETFYKGAILQSVVITLTEVP